MGTLLGASRELFIVLGDAEHHHPRIGVVHLLGLSANLLGAVPPVLCVVDQTLASWGRNRTVRTAVPLSPHRDTEPVHGRGGFSRFRETPLPAMLQPWTGAVLDLTIRARLDKAPRKTPTQEHAAPPCAAATIIAA